MGAGKYSAGRIFLQVVPSFKGVQKEISREVKKYNASAEKEQIASAEKVAKAAAKAHATESAKARVTEAKAEERAAREQQARLQKQIDDAVRMSNKLAEARARDEKKAADDARKATQKKVDDALAHHRQMRREERRHLDKMAELGERHRISEEAKDKASGRRKAEAKEKAQTKAEADEAARYDRHMANLEAIERKHEREMTRIRAKAYADKVALDDRLAAQRVRDAEKAAERLEREAQREANKAAAAEKARQAQEARNLAKHHADMLKAEREYNRKRGGAAREVLERAFKGIDEAIGSPDLASKYGKEFDRIKLAAKQLQNDLDKGFLDTTEARKRLRTLERDFERIGSRMGGGSTTERGNAREGLQALRAMRREYDALGKAQGGSRGFFKGLVKDSDDGANAFRIFNYRVLAVVSTLPLLVPLLAATAGGLIALGTAALGAGAGLGVMLLGFSGVGAAVKALGDVQDNAAKDALSSSKAMRNAARGVRDAQQSLTRARSEAARGAEDSARRVAAAEKRVADAQKDATKAQVDLMEARRQAQQEQQDLADKIAAGRLDERQALIDLFNAQVDYNAVMASGGSTNLEKEQSSINLERARLAIKEIRKENASMLADQQKAAAGGVDSSPGVQAAKDRALDQAEAVKSAEQDLADARREQGEAAADSALRIRDAQERLSDAQANYQEALTKTGDLGSSSMQKLEEAMGKLSPAGRAFALYLFSLRDYFYDIRDAAQEGMLPGVQDAMETLLGKYGPGFQRWVGSMATSLGGFFQKAAEVFTNPVWQDFFAMMEKNAAVFSGQFGEVFLNLLTAFAAIATAFAPFAVDMGNALVDLSKDFAVWAAGLKDSDGFRSFMEYLRETGPKVWEFLKAFGSALVAIGIAMAPVADKLLEGFTAFLNMIADMDPETLAAIVTAILGFVLASQLAAGAMQAFLTIKTPFHSVFGGIVFLLTALVVALVYAYTHWDDFREVVDKVIGFIKDNWKIFAIVAGAVLTLGVAFTTVFRVLSFLFGPLRALQMIFSGLRVAMLAFTGPVGLIILGVIALVAAFIWAYKNVDWFRNGVDTALKFIGTAVMWLWDKVIKPYFTFIWNIWKNVGAVIWWFWSGVVGPVFELIAAVFKLFWDVWIKPKIEAVGKAFGWLGSTIKKVWMDHVDPILDKFGLGASDLKAAWDIAIDGIGAAWESLKSMVYKPLEWIVNTVINRGFVDNFNKLAEIFGTSKIPRLVMPALTDSKAKPKLPKGTNAGMFATGGYTGDGAKYAEAGVVHKNEYVIRKESTNAIRSKYGLEVLDYMNRFGDLPGMGGYASGGLVQFGKRLQGMGFNVAENKAFGGVSPVHSKNSWHYRDGAIDVNYDGHGQAFETAKINSIIGLAKQFGLRTIWQYPNHFDHAHFDVGTGPDLGNFSGKSMSNTGEGLPWYLDKPIDFIRKAINGFTSKFDVEGVIGDFVTKVPLKVLDWATEKIQGIISSGNGDFDSARDYNNPMYGVQQWRSLVQSALSRVGQSQSLVDTVLRRMNQESSGDPKAINLWDENAKNGDPSKGLMQVIGSTFAAYRDKGLPNDVYNPMSNVVASMRYALARYGSLPKAYDRPGGYADGGLVGDDDGGYGGIADNGTMMYDNGGYLPPGLTTVLNLTGKPEPVFTADQFAGMGKSGKAGWNLDVDVHGTDLTAADVAGEIMWAVERAEHGGKYAGRSD